MSSVPLAPRGRGVRGEGASTQLDVLTSASETLIQSRVSGVDSAERYPPHPPAPLPRWGRGKPNFSATCSRQTKAHRCHCSM